MGRKLARGIGLLAYDDVDQQTSLRRGLAVLGSQWREIQMALIPIFGEMKDSVEDAFELLKRAVAALEKLAAEQERTNDLYAEANDVSLAKPRNVRKL